MFEFKTGSTGFMKLAHMISDMISNHDLRGCLLLPWTKKIRLLQPLLQLARICACDEKQTCAAEELKRSPCRAATSDISLDDERARSTHASRSTSPGSCSDYVYCVQCLYEIDTYGSRIYGRVVKPAAMCLDIHGHPRRHACISSIDEQSGNHRPKVHASIMELYRSLCEEFRGLPCF